MTIADLIEQLKSFDLTGKIYSWYANDGLHWRLSGGIADCLTEEEVKRRNDGVDN